MTTSIIAYEKCEEKRHEAEMKKYRERHRQRKLHKNKAERCYYCERELTEMGDTMKTTDHVVSLDRGGVNHEINYVISCFRCNSIKSNMTLTQFVRKIQEMIKSKRHSPYTSLQMLKILTNTTSLIVNCLKVYERKLFKTKRHREEYMNEA